jgi:hypothetical protein
MVGVRIAKNAITNALKDSAKPTRLITVNICRGIVPSFAEEFARMKWLKENGKVQDDERCKIIFPRLDAKERIRNEKKQRRIVLVTDEYSYSQFHARKEAWMLALENNPSLFMTALDAAMAGFNVIGWKEEQEGEGETLANA